MSEPITFTVETRGVCKICGAPAYHHLANTCEEHRTTKPKVDKASTADEPVIRVERPTAAPPSDAPRASKQPPAKGDDKAARAAELERSIVQDLNPVLLQGFAFLCRPVAPENFFVADTAGNITPTEIGQSILISEGEAKILAKGVTELEKSAIGTMAAASVGPLVPFAYGIAAVGVVVFHGYRMMQLRNALVLQATQQLQAEQAANAGVPYPTVGDDIAADFSGEGRPADLRGFGMTRPTNGSVPPDLTFEEAV